MKSLFLTIGLLVLSSTANSQSDDECRALSSQISFCDDGKMWFERNSKAKSAIASYRGGITTRLSFLQDDYGSTDGLTLDDAVAYVKTIAANAQNIEIEDLTILSSGSVEASGIIGHRIAIKGKIKFPPMTYVHAVSIFVHEDFNFRVTTFMSGREFSDHHKEMHDAVLAATRVSER